MSPDHEPAEQAPPSGHLALLTGSGLARRLTLAGLYALLTVLLASTIAQEIDAVSGALSNVGGVLPSALQAFGPNPTAVALLALGLVAFFLAAGTFLVSRDTGAAFALLAIGTVAWFLFPYSEVPWATVITGGDQTTLQAPLSAWLLGGAIIALATVELLLSARSALVEALEARGLPDEMVEAAKVRTTINVGKVLAGTLALGGLIALLYGVLRDTLSTGLLAEPDLIWVPALAGLVAAVLLYLVSRR